MRTRQTFQELERRQWAGGVIPGVLTRCDGTTAVDNRSFTGHNYVSSMREERISDSLGKGKPHPCVHRVHTRKYGERPGAFISPGDIGGMGVIVYEGGSAPWWDEFHHMIDSSLYWNVAGNSDYPPMWNVEMSNIDETKIVENLLDRARSLKADVALNIAEASQVWPSIRSLTDCIPEMARNWRNLRNVLKTASGAFLAWKFGVSPILSDIMAIQRYLPRMHDDIVRHAKGKAMRFSTSAELPCTFNPPVHQPLIWNGGPITDRKFYGRIISAPQMRYVLVVKPSEKGLARFSNKLDFFLKRFGSSPASLAWELVPFSFVVDWFVDLRSVLRAVDDIIGFEPYKIVSFTKSLTYELAASDHWRYMSPCTHSDLVSFELGSATYKNYERSLVAIPGSIPVWRPRFGKNQAGISAALITQKLSQLSGAKR